MSRSWYRFTDEESGPYTFQELAEMLAVGELVDNDLVRREEVETWLQVKEVVGLKRAAEQLTHPRERPASSKISEIPTGGLAPRPDRKVSPVRVLAGILSVAMIGFFGYQLCLMWTSAPTKFPEAHSSQLAFEVPKRLDQIRPKLPTTSSVPGLEPGVPALVPGFESEMEIKAPTLTHDLLTIVYVRYTGADTQDDLWMADRPSVELPFANHRPVASTVSPGLQEHPSLSQYGTELVYSEMGAVNKLWITTRENSAEPFGPPVELRLDGEGIEGKHCDNPQWVDANMLKVAVADVHFRQRRQLVFRRTSRDAPFKLYDALPIANPWPRYQFGNDFIRGYCPDQSGILLTAFHPVNKQYLTPEILLSTETLGSRLHEFDDTIWVAPKEDVILYCSPGPGENENGPRRLWMVHTGAR